MALPGLPQGQQQQAPQGGDSGKYVDDGQPNVSPEEQAQYDQFMGNALKLIYTPQGVRPEVLQALQAAKGAPSAPTSPQQPQTGEQAEGAQPEAGEGETPAEDAQEQQPADGAQPNDQGEGQGGNPAVMALAQTTVTIVGQLDDSAREAGKPISDDVLYHGGLDVLQELAEVADAAKIHDYTQEEMTGAFAQAVDMYRQKAIADGRTTDDTLKQQFGEINQADQQGKLGEILPGLGNGGPGQPPDQSQEA
jgi:hypothetical protein